MLTFKKNENILCSGDTLSGVFATIFLKDDSLIIWVGLVNLS